LRRFPIGFLLLVIACSGESLDSGSTTTSEDAASPTAVSTSTTTLTTVTTTTIRTLTADEWFDCPFTATMRDYNTVFGRPFNDHFNDFELSEAQLDCVEAQTYLDSWEADVNPAPDETYQALVDELFDRLSESFADCLEGETLGDYRSVSGKIQGFLDVFNRIQERSNAGN